MGWGERSNTKTVVVGSWKIKDKKKMVKMGFVLDSYKLPNLSKLWEEAERKALTQMPTLNLEHRFFQEDKTSEDGKIIYSFRYYTPPENRELNEGVN